jgi:MoxR-like ATPase
METEKSSWSVSLPKLPMNIGDLDIPSSLVEDLVLRRLYTQTRNSVRSLSNSLKLSFPIVNAIFQHLRLKNFFEIITVEDNDYIFTLSETGRNYAAKRFHISHYSGPAPVSLKNYSKVVREQVSKISLNRSELKDALSDLVLSDRFLDQLGPALISQTSLFLYGPTGNGKTSVAERLLRVYQSPILVPYAVEYDGQIIILYDPATHQRIDADVRFDPRYVLCRRPCILVGGELEPSMLELNLDETTRVYSAPLQMKANNGMLVIDDFGRQIIEPQYLLNRWIVPLDRRVDYLTLRYGIKFEIPFEIVVVFSTNLNPAELADEAFLRRIQNKIYVEPVDSEIFDEIFHRIVADKGINCENGYASFLRQLCQDMGQGELRACYPADILNILGSISAYEGQAVELKETSLERAASLYFTKMMNLTGDRLANTAQ